MELESSSTSSPGRPDLEEFLSALDGFLNKQSTATDLTYFKFLGIFCRSIGASEGHLLRKGQDDQLYSVISFGMGSDFDKEFNKASVGFSREPSPLNTAFKQKEVIAVVELEKDPDIPPWFMKIMKHQKFSSLVAVPLMGRKEPTGVLAAYYHDVCLFDQGTLDHLFMIGRMVGVATEKDFHSAPEEQDDGKRKDVDEFLDALTHQSHTKLQLYSSTAKISKKALEANGVICGPIRRMNDGLSMTIAAGAGISASSISQRLTIPTFLEKSILNKKGAKSSNQPGDWGKLKGLVGSHDSFGIAKPILWQKKLVGAIIGWRAGGPAFNEVDELTLSRIASISSIALNK